LLLDCGRSCALIAALVGWASHHRQTQKAQQNNQNNRETPC
jgi:hypothetical protein